jgi:flagellar biosynthesis chaperone FliJ
LEKFLKRLESIKKHIENTEAKLAKIKKKIDSLVNRINALLKKGLSKSDDLKLNQFLEKINLDVISLLDIEPIINEIEAYIKKIEKSRTPPGP